MRILHVSDWHIGRTTYNQSRAEDHDAVLAEIIAIARENKPDLILHTGDLFDHSRPAYTDMAMAMDVFAELEAIAPVVVIAGNHDSATLFTIFNQIRGDSGRLRFVGKALSDELGYLPFTGSDGTQLRLGVLPFVNAHQSVNVFDNPTQWAGRYAQRVGAIQAAISDRLHAGFDDSRDVAVFATHLHVTGAGLGGGERAGHVSDHYATNLNDLPPVAYAAFGHIHKPQPLPGKVAGWYAGSALQMDFGERGEVKNVVLVDLRPGAPAMIEPITLSGGRPLRRFDGTLAELRALAPTVGRELCLLRVHTDTHDPTLSQKVYDLLPDAVVLDIIPVAADRTLELDHIEPRVDNEEAGLLDLFSEYLASVGTPGAAATQVRAHLAEFLAAADEERDPIFPEEALLTAHACGSATDSPQVALA